MILAILARSSIVPNFYYGSEKVIPVSFGNVIVGEDINKQKDRPQRAWFGIQNLFRESALLRMILSRIRRQREHFH